MKNWIIIVVICFFSTGLFAQDPEKDPEVKPKVSREKAPDYHWNIKGDFKLPTPVFNKAFAKTVGGVADASVSLHYPIQNKFHIGAGFRYTFFQINDLVINSKTNANLQILSPFVRFSFEKFVTPNLTCGFGIRTGYSMLNFYSNTFNQNDTLVCEPRQQSLFLEPEFTIGLMAGENLYFSFILSHNIIFSEYGSKNVCLPNFSGLSASDSKGNYQFFCAGFGFTVFLVKPNSQEATFGF